MFLYNYQVKKKQPAIGGLLEVMTRHIVAAGQTYKRSEIVPIGYNFLSVPRSAREARQGAGSAVFAFFVFLFSFFLIRAPAPSWVSLARAVRAGKGGRWRKGGMGGNGGTLHKTPIVVQRATARCTKSPVLWRAVRRAIIAAQNGARALCA